MSLPNVMSQHRRGWCGLCWLVVAMLLLPGGAPVAAQTEPAAGDPLLAAVKPDQRDAIAAETADALSRYKLVAELRLPEGDEPARVVGTLVLTYLNTTDQELAGVPFRLYANGPGGEAGGMTIDDAHVAGTAAAPVVNDDGTVATVPFATPLATGATTTIELAFTAKVPVNSRDHYGIYNIDPQSGTWALAYWYPSIAGYDPDDGFLLDPPSRNGDPIFSDTALYDVTLTAPAGWRLATTGVAVEEIVDGSRQTQRIISGPVRDFAIVADSNFASVSEEVDGTTITSWFEPGDERAGEAVLTYAAQALALFNDLFGPYPYTELDLTAVELFNAAGVEFPQLIYIGAGYYTPDSNLDVPNGLDFTVAHEVAHQWWYALVGNNQYQHAFIDEGLTQYVSSAVYFGRVYDNRAAGQTVVRYLHGPFEIAMRGDNDQVVDTPTDAFEDGGDYVFIAYSKGPIGFAAIHEEIGDDAFFAALSAYYRAFRFEVAQPEDLKRVFEEASGENLDELWRHWFEAREGEDDLGALPGLR
ncbi:MAG: M1 family metallopeptidase [Chloroflexia bacterium]|nr:M1 family metallopeptidase [Chloroflexia bacterium]